MNKIATLRGNPYADLIQKYVLIPIHSMIYITNINIILFSDSCQLYEPDLKLHLRLN